MSTQCTNQTLKKSLKCRIVSSFVTQEAVHLLYLHRATGDLYIGMDNGVLHHFCIMEICQNGKKYS